MEYKNNKKDIGTVGFFHRNDNKEAILWAKKISNWIKINYPKIKITGSKPQVLIALGGDGSILEAARKYENNSLSSGPIIIGLNLGHIGFLASIREPKKFLPDLKRFFDGKYVVSERIMIKASVRRKGKIVFESNVLNEVVIQNLLGISEIDVRIESHPLQRIKGTGVLVATATGSTAYNLSAHGPIIMPQMECFIINEILDHNIPTPSIIVDSNKKISMRVVFFRNRGILNLSNKKSVDMVLVSDGEKIFPLKIGDVILARRSPQCVRFAELEEHYFFKSLQEKFAFK